MTTKKKLGNVDSTVPLNEARFIVAWYDPRSSLEFRTLYPLDGYARRIDAEARMTHHRDSETQTFRLYEVGVDVNRTVSFSLIQKDSDAVELTTKLVMAKGTAAQEVGHKHASWYGHRLVSEGAGLFHCVGCGITGPLDRESDNFTGACKGKSP